VPLVTTEFCARLADPLDVSRNAVAYAMAELLSARGEPTGLYVHVRRSMDDAIGNVRSRQRIEGGACIVVKPIPQTFDVAGTAVWIATHLCAEVPA
jgi:hypothetical protein